MLTAIVALENWKKKDCPIVMAASTPVCQIINYFKIQL